MHVGLDAHKKNTVGYVVYPDGKREGPFVVPTTRQALEHLAKKMSKGKMLVEASTSGKAVVRCLRGCGIDATLVHPNALMLTLRRNKNDKEDALHLALVGQIGAATEAYLPTEYEDHLRCLTRRRYDIVKRMTSLKNQAHAVLARNLVKQPPGKLPRESTRRRWERAEGLPEKERSVLRGLLREMAFLNGEHEELTLQLYTETKKDPIIARLMTLPGMDVQNAATIRGEYGDFTRFHSGKHAASYAGITPPNWQSGDKEMHGRITKRGSPFLRHALVEIAHHLRRYPGAAKRAYTKLQTRIGVRKALVATARRIATILWAMVTKERDYADQDAKLTELKSWRHRHVNRLLETDRRDEALQILNSHDPRRDRERGRWSA